MKCLRFAAAGFAAVLALAGCNSDIAGVTLPEPGNVAGAWSGTARWDALQGGAAAAVTSGAATAALFQSGGSILAGSSWQVTGLYTASITGTVDAQNNIVGTTTITVLAAPCQATAAFGGTISADGRGLHISVSFSDPGVAPCAGAPVGLELALAR